MKINYHKLMLDEIERMTSEEKRPKLLLHSCCAPCSSFVIEYLSTYFEMEVYFFNPNIHPKKEYLRRLDEQIRMVEEMGLNYQVIGPEHQSELFYEAVKGCERLGEGSERCVRCFDLRLEKAAEYAAAHGFEYFTTSLTISPMKNAAKLNELGEAAGLKYGVKFLNSDFKKNNGYKRSIELSKQYDLYRQHYCGCAFSIKEQQEREARKREQLSSGE
ncbi:epoxyqueuosine reductase QueH [Turicibacter sp. TJ11]|uniref:epoxyqueuosine reductase QueH n=1 Tax=Turicibacter sp. TJ11 TaxID=2806443 RepID=UPI001F3FB642|nr:epoxyqueuosine reductase QueH [Turicibacter sp. TJ11]